MSLAATGDTTRDAVRDAVLWVGGHLPFRLLLPLLARHRSPFGSLTLSWDRRTDPTAAFHELLAAGPTRAGTGFTVVAGHADCKEVLTSPDVGMLETYTELPQVLSWVREQALHPQSMGPLEPPSLLAIDPPRHTLLRRLMAGHFTPRRVEALRPLVAQTAERLLDEVEADLARTGETRFDLVSRYAARLPVAVIASLLGVPAEMHDQLRAWGDEAGRTLDGGLAWRDFHRCKTILRQMHGWMDQHLATLARDPGEDLLSQMLAQVRELPQDERPTPDEMRGLGLLVLVAGFETTVNLLGNAVVNLDRHPAQLERLAREPGLWPTAVEETLRLDPPVQVTARRSRSPITVGGQTLPAGHGFVVVLGAAGRDPRVFPDPDTFDVGRRGADQHLAFSAGIHYCLGAGLARMEAGIALPALYRRFPHLRVVGQPERRPTHVLRGYRRIEVAVDPR